MLRKQVLIGIGMLAAVAICLLTVFGSWSLAVAPPVSAEAGDRLAFVARWLLVPGLCLLAGIGMTANQRFLKADAIDGERSVGPGAFEVNLRYNQNTLEQTVLAAIAWAGLALASPLDDLSLIPKLALLFGVGRAAFWIGYLYAPWARAFGMGLTAYPSFGALVWLAWRALS